MLPFWFLYIAAALRLAGGFAYLVATIKGKAKPNPLSWFLWGVNPLIVFFAGLSSGVGSASVVPLALGISPLLVFIAVMFKNPRLFQLDASNLVCGFLAIVGIVLWQITSDPYMAIALSILADISATIPTIRKTIKRPYTEYAPTYMVSSISMVIAIMAIENFDFATIAFPLYALIINIYIIVLIVFARWYAKRVKARRKLTRRMARQHKRAVKKIRKNLKKRARKKAIKRFFRL